MNESSFFMATYVFDEDFGGDGVSSKRKNEVAARFRSVHIPEMQQLLEGVELDLNRIADWVVTSNPMRCISMLGEIGWTLERVGERQDDPLRDALISCQDKIQRHLFEYLERNFSKVEIKSQDGSGRTMAEAFVLAKSDVAVLNEVSALPSLIDRFEGFMSELTVDEKTTAKQIAIDNACAKLLDVVFRAINRAADLDSKKSIRLRLVNFCTLEEILQERSARVSKLDEFLKAALEARSKACHEYASVLAEKEFGAVLEIAYHMHVTLGSGGEVLELPFQPGCSREAVLRTVSSQSGHEKSLKVLHKRATKHLAALQPELFNSVWTFVLDFVTGWLVFLDSILRTPAYSYSMSPSPKKLRLLKF